MSVSCWVKRVKSTVDNMQQPNLGFLLIIANSARMAAQAAWQLGWKPLVIDVYADIDTRKFAVGYLCVASLAPIEILPAVETFIERYAVSLAVYGSGFENYPESLNCLAQRLRLLGNSAECFVQVQDKEEFFSRLTAFDIPFPETRFHPPSMLSDWLVKPLQGQGGVGIHRANDVSADGYYWQRYQRGLSQSVLFIADGYDAQVIGFNSQWTVDGFIFAGIINNSSLTPIQQDCVSAWIARLTAVYGLKGLNSMDLIQNGDLLYVLEINPRLSASMQLYGEKCLQHHIEVSLNGRLKRWDWADDRQSQSEFTAYQIVYAKEDTQIPTGFVWLPFCQDTPKMGSICRKNQPICSIMAVSKTPEQVFNTLRAYQQIIFTQLR